MKGTIYCIVGRNGIGKTRYVDRLRKTWTSDKVRYVSFDDAYGASTDKSYYLQLRWNQHDIDQETPTVGELLERTYLLTGGDTPHRRELKKSLYGKFGLEKLLDKYIILLSSGELRKYQLTKTLMAEPTTLILDNPFIGLDAEARQIVSTLLQQLAQDWDITIYLVLAKASDIPPFANEVLWLKEHDKEPQRLSIDEFCSKQPAIPPQVISDEVRDAILRLPAHDDDYASDTVVDLHDVTIRYGQRTILRHLNWHIKGGERWALSGQNGSGKSLLLSLICADNPQSYACDITLFGRKRGTGETIWDIKRHIGYVSPEMQRSYQRALPTLHIVASGLKDTVGLYVHPNAEERERCRWWLQVFGIDHLAERPFTTLSSGEQRLALLARAFVKDPELLILDEPLHGLDATNSQMVRNMIDTFCERPHKTLIMVTHYEEELPQCITHRIQLTKQQ